jgi:FixJ family two-component response regulator
MPGIDGRQLSERMKALGCRAPILFVSRYGDPDEPPPMPETAGSRDRFIAKPFEFETLFRTVRGMLEPV